MNKIQIIVLETGHLSKKAISGGESLIQNMIPFLANRFNWKIILPKFAQKHWLNKKNSSFHSLPPLFSEKYNHLIIIFLVYWWRIFHTTLFLLKQSTPFILYSSTNVFVDVVPGYFLKILGKKFIWCTRIHHLVSNPQNRSGNFILNCISFILDRLTLNLIKTSDLILVLNSRLKKNVSALGFSRQKIKILGGGVSIAKISSFTTLKKTLSFSGVYVGRLHRTKGVLDLPMIWKYVVRQIPGATLAIIGELSDHKLVILLKKNISQLKLQKNIKILGFLNEEKKLSVLKKSSVFIFSDHENGFSLATLEAMASGLPAVGYDIGLTETVFKKGLIVAPLHNYSAFANKIIHLLKQPGYYRHMSEAAKTQASKYDWKITTDKFGQLLTSVLKK